jgi:phosphopantetheinyl transferase (holo-ACP synthase)
MIIQKERTEPISNVRDRILKLGMEHCFSENERTLYFNGTHYSRLAARLLVKELLCEQFPQISDLREISIENDSFGKPHLILTGSALHAKDTAEGLRNIHISLSHSKSHARALVIFEYF